MRCRTASRQSARQPSPDCSPDRCDGGHQCFAMRTRPTPLPGQGPPRIRSLDKRHRQVGGGVNSAHRLLVGVADPDRIRSDHDAVGVPARSYLCHDRICRGVDPVDHAGHLGRSPHRVVGPLDIGHLVPGGDLNGCHDLRGLRVDPHHVPMDGSPDRSCPGGDVVRLRGHRNDGLARIGVMWRTSVPPTAAQVSPSRQATLFPPAILRTTSPVPGSIWTMASFPNRPGPSPAATRRDGVRLIAECDRRCSRSGWGQVRSDAAGT